MTKMHKRWCTLQWRQRDNFPTFITDRVGVFLLAMVTGTKIKKEIARCETNCFLWRRKRGKKGTSRRKEQLIGLGYHRPLLLPLLPPFRPPCFFFLFSGSVWSTQHRASLEEKKGLLWCWGRRESNLVAFWTDGDSPLW